MSVDRVTNNEKKTLCY